MHQYNTKACSNVARILPLGGGERLGESPTRSFFFYEQRGGKVSAGDKNLRSTKEVGEKNVSSLPP